MTDEGILTFNHIEFTLFFAGNKMKWSTVALTGLLVATASAFSPAGRSFVARPAPRFDTAVMANVRKLSDPMSQILDQTDVFIFDCDGVIWRVCEEYKCT